MGGKSLWLMLCMVVLSGCAHARPEPQASCRYRALPLKISANHPAGFVDPAPTLQSELLNSSATPAANPAGLAAPPAQPQAREVLILSGGSQNGVFGGGLFVGLPDRPTYDVVTGVSTGALLSTLLFLANSPEPTDRVYPDDRGLDPNAFPARQSNISDLGLALSISAEKALLKAGSNQVYDGLVHGSVGSLKPLGQRLTGFLSAETFRLIRAERYRNRKLYVAVADLDDGLGYALDMAELASRVDEPAWAGRLPVLQQCYVDALLASSSVPIGAYPVPLDIEVDLGAGRTQAKRDLFVDGGVRFGVFFRQIEDEPGARDLRPTNVTLVVNGRLYGKDWLEGGQRVEKWSAISLVKRTVDMLANQVYRFSVDDVERFPRNGGKLKVAFISNENLAALPEEPDAHRFNGDTCRGWAEFDDKQSAPVEFHPRYMACMLDYGRTRGRQDPWNLELSGPQ